MQQYNSDMSFYMLSFHPLQDWQQSFYIYFNKILKLKLNASCNFPSSQKMFIIRTRDLLVEAAKGILTKLSHFPGYPNNLCSKINLAKSINPVKINNTIHYFNYISFNLQSLYQFLFYCNVK